VIHDVGVARRIDEHAAAHGPKALLRRHDDRVDRVVAA
jgi:hypothetical protein